MRNLILEGRIILLKDFGFVKNCLPGTFNYFPGLYYQENRKNSRTFHIETFSFNY